MILFHLLPFSGSIVSLFISFSTFHCIYIITCCSWTGSSSHHCSHSQYSFVCFPYHTWNFLSVLYFQFFWYYFVPSPWLLYSLLLQKHPWDFLPKTLIISLLVSKRFIILFRCINGSSLVHPTADYVLQHLFTEELVFNHEFLYNRLWASS